MNKITVELTREELLEVGFCVKRYSQLYPNFPNEYFNKLRSGIINKLTDAFIEYQNSEPDDIGHLTDETTKP